MNIKYFVRTTNERELDKSYAQIDYVKVVDLEHKPVKSLIEQFKIINEYDSVLLEDDLILCKDFKNKIESVINQYSNEIITFFSKPNDYIYIHKDNIFSYCQCRFYPKGSLKIFINELNQYINEKKVAPFFSKIAKENNIKLFHYRPCLVQHLDNDSLVHNQTGYRRTPYFIDYLDELGITYDEAKKPENQVKLFNLMKEKFKGIDNK